VRIVVLGPSARSGASPSHDDLSPVLGRPARSVAVFVRDHQRLFTE